MTEPAAIDRPQAQYTSDWTDAGTYPDGQQFHSGAMLPLLYGETSGSSEVLIDVDTAHAETILNLLADRVALTYHITAELTGSVAGAGHLGLTVLHNGAPGPGGSALVQVQSAPATARVVTQVHVPGGLVPAHIQFRLDGSSEINVRTLTVSVAGQPG
jgi:hypothetical protein